MIIEHEKRVPSLGTVVVSTYIANLHKKKKGLEALKPDEIKNLLHYMDPNLDGHLTKSELKHAVRRAHMPPNRLYAEYQCSIVMDKLERYMHKNEMRLKDLFNTIDKDRSGYLSTKEFEAGVKNLVGLKKSSADAELGSLLMASKDELMARFDEGAVEGKSRGSASGDVKGASSKAHKFKRSQTGF